MAQLVARYLGVVEAASSSLVTQTNKNGDVSSVWTAPFFALYTRLFGILGLAEAARKFARFLVRKSV